MIVIFLAALGIIYAILDRMVFSGDQPIYGILLLAFIVFALLTLTYVVFKEDLKEKRMKVGRASTSPPAELEMPAVTARLLEEKGFEPIPAVIE